MARMIGSSVGRMGGKNLPMDVITVQQLLDQVPAHQGGPVPLLDVDGLCGPKTIAAIQKFQLHHFGWSIADGRVDPGGPTLAKLNEFDNNSFPLPVLADTPLLCPHGGQVKGTSLSNRVVLTTSDKFVVTGCLLTASPCVTVKWLGPPGKPLNQHSQGTCFNSKGGPQGPVIMKFF
jgi:hypothetical protein